MRQNGHFRFNYFHLIAFLLWTLLSCKGTDPDAYKISSLEAQIENSLVSNIQFKGDTKETFTLANRMAELNIPGVSIAVAKDGELIWSKAYGFADIEENKPMNTETMLLCCSVSKIITAARVIQLVEEGEIKLQEDVNTYLTSWKVPENEFTVEEKVTIERLLEHRSGINGRGGTSFDIKGLIPTTIELLNGVNTETAPVKVIAIPGGQYEYSANNYLILQQMIEDIDDMSFTSSLKQNVLDPLGMTSSTFENPLPSQFLNKAASAYTDDGEKVEGKYKVPTDLAAAGLWSTPSDLLKYITQIQNTLQREKDEFITFEMVNQMRLNERNTEHLGMIAEEYTFGHPGGCTGFNAIVLAWKKQPYAIAILVNGDSPVLRREIAYTFSQVFELPSDHEPKVYEAYDMNKDHLEKYTGHYKIIEEGLGDIQIKIKNNKLQYDFIKMKTPVVLTPISDSVFIDKDGYKHSFVITNGVVTKYMGWGFMESIKFE